MGKGDSAMFLKTFRSNFLREIRKFYQNIIFKCNLDLLIIHKLFYVLSQLY